jgi:hypothetical protein
VAVPSNIEVASKKASVSPEMPTSSVTLVMPEAAL